MFSFGEKGKLGVEVGAMYYRELNEDVYDDMDASMTGFDGKYYIDGYKTDMNRAIFSVKTNYSVDKLNVYGEFSHTFSDNDNTAVDAGVKLSF